MPYHPYDTRLYPDLPYILHYFHVECVFETFKRAKDISNVIINASDIAGIQNITHEERTKIEDFIGNLDVDRLKRKKCNKSGRDKQMNKNKMDGRKKLKPHNEPLTKVLFTNGDQMNSTKFQELQKHIDREKP